MAMPTMVILPWPQLRKRQGCAYKNHWSAMHHFIFFRTDFLQTNEAVCNFQDIQVQWRMRMAFHEMANKWCHHIAESWGIFLWQSQRLTPLLHRSGTCLNKRSKGSSTASWGTFLAVCWGHDYQHYHDFWLQPAVWGDWMWTNVFLGLGSSKKLFFYPTITVVLFVGAVFFFTFLRKPRNCIHLYDSSTPKTPTVRRSIHL